MPDQNIDTTKMLNCIVNLKVSDGKPETLLQPPISERKQSDQLQSPELNKVGQSVFYDCVDLSPMAEKQDDMKPERSDTEEESKIFARLYFS